MERNEIKVGKGELWAKKDEKNKRPCLKNIKLL